MSNKNKSKLHRAFSLVEISIVILIIGALVAGIANVSSLYRDYKINIARKLARESIVARTNDLVVWLDTTSEGALDSYQEGASVLNWYNKIPLTLPDQREVPKTNASAPAGNAPTLRLGGINGLPALHFNGFNKFMELNSGYEGTSSKETTLFVVWQPLSRAGNVKILSRGTDSSAFQIEDDNIGHLYYARIYCCNGATTFITSSNSYEAKVGNTDVVVASIIDANKLQIWTNNKDGFVATASSSLFQTNANLKIGGNTLNGLISEVIVYKRWLDAKERVGITNYLIKKWNIKSN